MAKGTGLIGNFKGKVGNTVGYKLSASNNGQTQGIRVYQPIVKNPKTAAQAEQRAKLSPINATYRALKMVIDRGNESLPYGNKSRIAWLKSAFKAQHMPWFEKGALVTCPVGCQLTKGSLPSLIFSSSEDGIEIQVMGATSSTPVATIGNISTALLDGYSFLKAGDQITLVSCSVGDGTLNTTVFSFVIDATSTEAISGVTAGDNIMTFENFHGEAACAVIVSREGTNGEHLRSTTSLEISTVALNTAPYKAEAKTAAIESYMNSAANNSDWAEESIQ